MNKITCAHCGRDSNMAQYNILNKGNNICIVYICSVCASLLKKVDLNFTIDDDKIQAYKEAMKLNKERIEEKEKKD